MEFAGTFPRFITLRRDGFIVSFIGILIQLWRFLSQATILLSVIGSFSVFVAPMTGILVADYWLVRRHKWKILDLYSNTGIYWYFYGLNWRAFLAFCIAWAPAMRKCLPSLVL
jgi:NCS1 family nucleobase:cation symporter-1